MPETGCVAPAPRCPACRWLLAFAPMDAVYEFCTLRLWEGYCRNPECEHSSFGASDRGVRVIAPADAAYA